jgi:hypothetical protein
MIRRICAILCIIASGVAAPMITKAQVGSPEAVLPEAEYRFGTTIEGETVRHDFILRNKGKTDLKIEKIKTG